ncbi:hypothetical protein [Sphingobium bisphenolivorans]|uniref:hypothetical protein n=1 Tax=Sphingobium bisphenolivorans TaxID=1335760 RepID=UPI0003B48E24|nr:hypothetical protein [Sphingobium bisphenolivorans]
MTKPDEDAPIDGAAPAAPDQKNLAAAARNSAGKSVWTGAAVGIGSAAIVAALLYANRKSR